MIVKPEPLEVEDLPELFGDDDFAVREASQFAIAELKAAGISIFYFDPLLKLEVMELANGKKFEIQYINKNADFEVVREIL
jgi:hypothetical protein